MSAYLTSPLPFVLASLLFVSIALLHLTKKNAIAVWLYVVQASAIALLLLLASVHGATVVLVLTLAATVLVKLFIAPAFFFRLIRRHQLRFSASTYLNTPVALFAIAAIVVLTRAIVPNVNVALTPLGHNLLTTSASSIFVSLFLLVNRKGALSQMLGVLSLENSIVAFALFAGLEQGVALQLGILFILVIWITIATVFASMIYRHFGTLDVTEMQTLTA